MSTILPFHKDKMAKVAATLSFSTIAGGSGGGGGGALASKLPPIFFSPSISILKLDKPTKIHAKLGGGDGEVKPAQKKKFITKEEEPDQYWQTAGEREGENPMKTPLPYIIIFGMSTPFVILAIAFANGWIKVPVR